MDRIMQRCMQYANHDSKFANWLAKVDTLVEKQVGVSLFDLEDFPLRDWFDDNVSATEAANMALEEAGV